MNKIPAYATTQAAKEFNRMPAGGYVCIIKKVEDHPEKEFLTVEVDVAEGEYKNYALDTMERAGFWPLKFNRFYGSKSLKFFKAFIEAIEQTNNRYTWNWDEQSLVNKGIGIVFQDEEFEKKDGRIGTRLVPYLFITATRIREHDYIVPAPKLINHVTATPTFEEEVDDGTLPF